MQNIRLNIMYDGSNYAGWQRLGKAENKKSIQAVLEEGLRTCLQEDIKVIGSGRTDAGVHAWNQTVNFYCKSKRIPHWIMEKLNTILPKDICIIDAVEVKNEFHSRYSAKNKTYEYRIHNGETRQVFQRKYTLHIPEPLNLKAMEEAAAYLMGTHDFKAFSSDRKDEKSTVRTIEAIQIKRYESHQVVRIIKDIYQDYAYANEIRICFTGDGFLYNMIRIMVGTLLEVGLGKRNPQDIKQILESKSRQMAGVTVQSQGLFLVEVKY